MPQVPFALSVHHFIQSVGADAGFAAIIGLALLVLLFFAQARETANLRRRADEAEDHVAQLEAYVDQLARMGAAAQSPAAVRAGVTPPPASAVRAAPAARVAAPRVAAAAAPSVSRVAAPLSLPFAPAGTGAPALASATKLIPSVDPSLVPIAAVAAADHEPDLTAALAAGSPGPITAVRAAASEQTGGNTVLMDPPAVAVAAAALPVTPAPEIDPPAPPPSTAAAGAVTASPAAAPSNGAPRSGPVPVAPPPVGFAPAGPPPFDLDEEPPPRVRLRPHVPGHGRPSAPAPRRQQADGKPPAGGRRSGRVAVAIAAVLAVVVVGVGYFLLNSNSNTSTAQTQANNGSSASASSSTAASSSHGRNKHDKHAKGAAAGSGSAASPADVTVSVLNATSTPNLAATVMSKLTAAGYQQGATTNSQSQRATTAVEYVSAADKADAQAVAKALSLGASTVGLASASDLSVACGATPTDCPSKVIVAVGADLASTG